MPRSRRNHAGIASFQWSWSTNCVDGKFRSSRQVATSALGAGNPCSTDLTREKLCSLCKMSAWTAWTACEDSSIPRRRERTVVSEPSNGAPACPHKKEQSGCALCEISQWTSWGPVVAVSKKRNRTRRVIVEPVNTSKTCPDLLESQSAQDCEMGDWEAWSSAWLWHYEAKPDEGHTDASKQWGEPCSDVQDLLHATTMKRHAIPHAHMALKDFESKRVVRPVAMWLHRTRWLEGEMLREPMPLQFPFNLSSTIMRQRALQTLVPCVNLRWASARCRCAKDC